MSDTVEAASVTAPAPGKKARGRPVKSAPETPQQRINRLEAELEKAHAAKKRVEQQRDAIVGKVVVTHAFAHADFRCQLASILRAEVKNKADLVALAELLE